MISTLGTFDYVVLKRAVNRIVAAAADGVLDIADGVALARETELWVEINGDAGCVVFEAHGVVTVFAIDQVAVSTAIQYVVAGASEQKIDALSAKQRVITSQAVQRVRAAATLEDIGFGVALELIACAATDNVLDRNQRIGAVAGILRTAEREIHRDRCNERGERCGVGAFTTVEQVVSGAADQDVVGAEAEDLVVAGEAVERVGIGSAGEHVVSGCRRRGHGRRNERVARVREYDFRHAIVDAHVGDLGANTQSVQSEGRGWRERKAGDRRFGDRVFDGDPVAETRRLLDLPGDDEGRHGGHAVGIGERAERYGEGVADHSQTAVAVDQSRGAGRCGVGDAVQHYAVGELQNLDVA